MAKKVHFSNQSIKEIELSDGSKVKIKGIIDYLVLEAAIPAEKDPSTKENLASALGFLKAVILSWDLVGADGNIIEYKPELVDILDVNIINEIATEAMKVYSIEKKSSKQ